MPRHPMQPIVMVGKVARFRENKIVRYLLDYASARGCSLNTLATMPFSADDRSQLAQLIGYSVCGYGELDYAPPSIVREADSQVDKLIANLKRPRG